MRALLLLATGLVLTFALGASAEKPKATQETQSLGYNLAHNADTGGLWVNQKYSDPGASLYSQKRGGGMAVLGFQTDANSAKGHDFAIVADRSKVYFQVIDENGGLHHIPVTALLKLEKK